MEAILFIFYAIMVWLIQSFVAGLINLIRGTRIPVGIVDFIRLTFAPYVIFCIIFKNKMLD